MKFRHFLLAISLLAASLLSANNSPIPFYSQESAAFEKDSCSFPAPVNFHVEGLGPNWVKLAWDAPPTPRAHRIRIYRESDNALLSTNTIPAGTSDATIGIPFNTPVYALINAICLDGSHSPHCAERRFQGVILDVIVSGFQGSSNPSYCNFTGDNSCELAGSGYNSFKISINGLFPKQFGVEPGVDANGNLKYFIRLPSANSNNDYSFNFYCDTDIAPCSTDDVKVTFRLNGVETVVGYIDAYQTSSTHILHGNLYTYGGTNCRIDRLTPDEQGRPTDSFISDRANIDGLSINSASASPNPFSETLDVYLPQNAAEKVRLQVLNLSGQKVLEQQFEGGQAQYTLSTTTLSNGFYLLHIETDGKVQTLKVVKSE